MLRCSLTNAVPPLAELELDRIGKVRLPYVSSLKEFPKLSKTGKSKQLLYTFSTTYLKYFAAGYGRYASALERFKERNTVS
mmetsp:Transcript_28812/g.66188  ORF Transcript_28812/g.66188 Transcript_28812/m.66188 type:complete len:81 (+) Transcript_28812:264-506(+)